MATRFSHLVSDYLLRKCSHFQKKENFGVSAVSQIPNEILLRIFEFLSPSDLSKSSQVCRRFWILISSNRHRLPLIPVSMAAIRYGYWHDVLCGRSLTLKDPITYRISDELSIRKPKKSGFPFRSSKPSVPFRSVAQHCSFRTILIAVEMLNADMVEAICLQSLHSAYIYLDLSHHSLRRETILRYLVPICESLCRNPYLLSVDLILKSTNEEMDTKLLHKISNQIGDCKRVSVIFVDSFNPAVPNLKTDQSKLFRALCSV